MERLEPRESSPVVFAGISGLRRGGAAIPVAIGTPARSRRRLPVPCREQDGGDCCDAKRRVACFHSQEFVESPPEPLDIDVAAPKVRVAQHPQMKIARRLDSLYGKLEQRALHPLYRLIACRRGHDELADH